MENLRLGAPSRLNNDLTLYLFPQNKNARRGMANDKYQKMRVDLEAEKGKTTILKEQIIKNKSLFSFCAFPSYFCAFLLRVFTVYFVFSDLQSMSPRPRILSSSPSTSSSWTARTRSLRRRRKKC